MTHLRCVGGNYTHKQYIQKWSSTSYYIRPSGWLHFSLFTRGFYGCPTMTANNRPTRKPDKYRWLPEVRFGEVMVPAYGHLDW